MGRCKNTSNLEVHHKQRYGSNDLDNTKVLCHNCYTNTSTYAQPRESLEPFSKKTKKETRIRAGNKCECTLYLCGTH